MYMSSHEHLETVGVAQLRQNLSAYLKRVAAGERLVVTDHNRPVAELTPLSSRLSPLDRLIAEGRVNPPRRPGPLPKPLKLEGDPRRLSKALEAERAED